MLFLNFLHLHNLDEFLEELLSFWGEILCKTHFKGSSKIVQK